MLQNSEIFKNISKNYNFFRIPIVNLDLKSNNDEFISNFIELSLVGVNFINPPIIAKNFHDPLIYLIIKCLIEDLIFLKINFDNNLIMRLKLSFEKNQYDLFDIFKDLIKIIIDNSLCINNINVYIMAEYPRFKNKNIDSKILIANNIRKIFENQFGNKTNIFLKKISVHAGTGEKIGSVGNSKAIDIHVLTNLVKIEESKEKFIGYGFDRHQIIDCYNPYYKKDKDFNNLGICKFFFRNALQIKAHSDGDLILHSICDAILGAIGASDIGNYFPDTDPVNKNRNSLEFVKFALNLALKENLKLKGVNIRLFVNYFIFDDLIMQDALNKINKSISFEFELSKEFVKFEIIPIIPNSDQKSCVARSEGIESQVFVFFEKIDL